MGEVRCLGWTGRLAGGGTTWARETRGKEEEIRGVRGAVSEGYRVGDCRGTELEKGKKGATRRVERGGWGSEVFWMDGTTCRVRDDLGAGNKGKRGRNPRSTEGKKHIYK